MGRPLVVPVAMSLGVLLASCHAGSDVPKVDPVQPPSTGSLGFG